MPVVGSVDVVICPPYDIITEQQRVALLARSPYNVVRVELPNGHYAEAARLLQGWQASRALVREHMPALYGYRMSYVAPNGDPRHTLGVMGALVLEPPGKGILPHENTTPKAKSDRLELIRATQANTSPIWCLSSETGLADVLGPVPLDQPEGSGGVISARDDEGTLHEIWPVTDPLPIARWPSWSVPAPCSSPTGTTVTRRRWRTRPNGGPQVETPAPSPASPGTSRGVPGRLGTTLCSPWWWSSPNNSSKSWQSTGSYPGCRQASTS